MPAFLLQHCLRHVHRYCTMKVICAVYGPHAQTGRDSSFSEEGQLQCDFSYSPFATPGGRRETRGARGDDERELSTLLRQTLEASVQVNARPLAQHYHFCSLYSVPLLAERMRLSCCTHGIRSIALPFTFLQVHRLTKSVVDVRVMVLQADGGELAVATTCASMALADAGIELYDLVTACSVGYNGTRVRHALHVSVSVATYLYMAVDSNVEYPVPFPPPVLFALPV